MATAKPSGRLALLMLALAGTSAAGARAQTIDTLALRTDTRILSADSLRGRGTGAKGERIAAGYIAERLRALCLEPAHPSGYIVPLPLLRARLSPASEVSVRHAASERSFATDAFASSIGGLASLESFAGPVVFVRSTSDPAANGDLEGKVILTYGPLGEAAAATLRRWIAAGVAGVVLPIADPIQFRGFMTAGTGRDLLVNASVDEPVWQPDLPVLIAGPALVTALVANRLPSEHDGISTPHDLGTHFTAELVFDTTAVPSANVAALLRGEDPQLRDEYVVLTAHYDHLGIGEPIDGDSIYNGFSDNAAGVAMLLAVAEQLRQDRPARSVILLFPSGEEVGLLGSAYWASHAPVPIDRIRAVLNLDAGAPPAAPVRWRVAGDTTLHAVLTAARVIRDRGWTADITPANANSDHWPFMDRGVPTVFLVPGAEWEGMDDAQRIRLRERWDRYHAPADEYHPDFPFQGLVRYTALALEITRALAGSRRF
jgi:hypothetical protein